jgi:YfiH family protein
MVLPLIRPDWPAPPMVRAVVTTRAGGVSLPPYDSLNLGDHVGDDPAAVRTNRQRLSEALSLPAAPRWLRQVHGTCSVEASACSDQCEADAAHTRTPGIVCAVLTADCLPLLLCDREGRQVAAVHAGWRGLLNGVIEQTLARMAEPEALLAWMGPAIGPRAFEVGEEVHEAFCAEDSAAEAAFSPSASGRYLADIYALARQRLTRAGVVEVSGGDYCTYSEPERFYSYRRDGQTGRMASLIWIDETIA